MCRKSRNIRLAFVVSATLLGGVGCYGDIRDYCNITVSCMGGNEADEDACVELHKGKRKVAKEYDCYSEWKDMMECLADKTDCDNNKVVLHSTKCRELTDDYQLCEAKSSDWGE